jgi:regulator of cell morphogenesis and NO signaling
VARVHSDENPELLTMQKLVAELKEEMLEHLEKEESVSFPLIKELESGVSLNGVHNVLIHDLEEEHEKAGDLMKELEILSNGFTPPMGACTSYMLYFKLLQEFQDDLHKHVHLENNVLFPKVDELLQPTIS